MPSLLVSWPCLCVCLFPPESLQALATAVLCNHLCNSAQHHSPCIFCHCMGQLKTHLMLYTWFPELLPVYCPLLPSPLANIHVVLLCYRWVGASHRVPGPRSAPDTFNSTGQKFWEVLQQKPHSPSAETFQKHHSLLASSPFTNTVIIVQIKMCKH